MVLRTPGIVFLILRLHPGPIPGTELGEFGVGEVSHRPNLESEEINGKR